MRTLLNLRLTLKMERMAGNYFSSKTWHYKIHNKKSPYIPIILFCLANETNGSMCKFSFNTTHSVKEQMKLHVVAAAEQWESLNASGALSSAPSPSTTQAGRGWSTASPPSWLLSQPPHVTSLGSPQSVEWTCQNHTLWEGAARLPGVKQILLSLSIRYMNM